MKTYLNILVSFLLFLTTSWANPNAGESYLFRRNSTGLTDVVTWDPQSLSILGQRVFVLSAEIHPWRLPGNPNLWADLFQKVKANGFSCVSAYFSWALHYPAPDTNDGQGDFQAGTYRDLQMFIDSVQAAGLWLIARYEQPFTVRYILQTWAIHKYVQLKMYDLLFFKTEKRLVVASLAGWRILEGAFVRTTLITPPVCPVFLVFACSHLSPFV